MGDLGDYWRDHRDESRQRALQNLLRTVKGDFDSAQRLARANGMDLLQLSDQHFRITRRDLWLDIYPGCQRLKSQERPSRWPYLLLKVLPWSLSDVVRASIRAFEHERRRQRPQPTGRRA